MLKAYVRTISDLARYFKRPPDQLGPDQLREYQAYKQDWIDFVAGATEHSRKIREHIEAAPHQLEKA